MDTYCTVTVYGGDVSEAERLILQSCNRACTLLGENGYLFFAESDGQQLALSEDAKRVVSLSLRISELTGGVFDITVAPLSSLWNIKEASAPPSEEEIRAATALIGCQGVFLDGDALVFSSAGRGIDLGAVGKGFAAECSADALRAAGITQAVINLGGNITVLGDKNGEGYLIGIRNPEGGLFGTVRVSDCSVVTSGGYERYFEYQGRRYHHILDPRTGYPAESGLISATAISSDHLLADILSTVFFLCGEDESRRLFPLLQQEFPSLQGAVLVPEGGKAVVLGAVDFSLAENAG